jgi:DivIVA domain-containing protein
VTERDSDSLLPMLTNDVEHVVRFTPSWRGYARSEVDAYVTRTERELSALRARVEDLEAALHETAGRHDETAAEAARWKALYEDSVPPFEELGTRVAEILGLADAEARERVRAAEDEASGLVGEAGVRAASMVTEAEERAAARESEAEERASTRETQAAERATAREAEAEQRAADTVASAERRAAELQDAAEQRASARESEAAARVEQLQQEHATLVERLSGIRDVLSQLPGLGPAAAAGLAGAPEDFAAQDVPPEAPVDVAPAEDPDATQLVTPVADDEPADPDATVVGAVPAVDETQVQQVVRESGSGTRRR